MTVVSIAAVPHLVLKVTATASTRTAIFNNTRAIKTATRVAFNKISDERLQIGYQRSNTQPISNYALTRSERICDPSHIYFRTKIHFAPSNAVFQ